MRLPAEPVLRQDRPDEDDRRVREREQVDAGQPDPRGKAEGERDETGGEHELLPGRDGVERVPAQAGVPQLRHREVVQRQPSGERGEGGERDPPRQRRPPGSGRG